MRLKFRNSVVLGAALALSLCLNAHATIAEHVQRVNAAGVDVLTYPMGVKDVVTLAGSLPAGDYFATRAGGNPTLATLTGMLLDKGTTKADKFAIAKQLDDVGAELNFTVDTQTVDIHGRALRKDLPRLIRILAEELREPAFSPEELAKAKKQLVGNLRQALENTNQRAREAFLLAAFPPGHPNRPTPLKELLAAVDSATVDEVRGFYRAHYGPTHLELVFAGDVDIRAIQAEVKKDFSGWKGGVPAVRGATSGLIHKPSEERIAIPGKTSVSVIIGERSGLRYEDADYIPLRVGTAILGSGFTGRLMHTVRDQEGLTYGISASLAEDVFVDGTFAVTATFAPALLDRGVTSARNVLTQWRQEGVTADELSDRKTNLVGIYQVSLSTTEGMAQSILTTLERGKPLSWLDDYAKSIDALTVEQVNAVIQKYVDPGQAIVIEAGTFETK